MAESASDPNHEPTEDRSEFATRPESLEEGKVAYVDLGKPNGQELYESLKDVFINEFGVQGFEYFKKSHYSTPMPDDQIEEVVDYDPDAVIEAISDCGSCNSSSVVDAVEFEQQGIPTVQIITEDFIELNQNISSSYGYEELAIIPVQHPTRYLDRDEIDEMTERIKWSVTTMLTCEECLSGVCSINAKQP